MWASRDERRTSLVESKFVTFGYIRENLSYLLLHGAESRDGSSLQPDEHAVECGA